MSTRTRTAVVYADLAVQLLLIGIGAVLIAEQDDAAIVEQLVVWSLVASAYCVGAMLLIGHSLRRPPPASHTTAEHSRVARVISTVATFVSSTVGLGAALTLLLLRDDPHWGEGIQVIGVWSMLVAWALFHWGYARIYAARYRLATRKPLDFPGDDEPRLADFVYFSFTNATAFSTSDVAITTPRMRWTVVWHSTLGFFFNAIIVVLAVNTIIA